MPDLLQSLAVAVITGLLAMLGAWWAGKRGQITEHEQWLRNERLEVYMRFLTVDQPLTMESVLDDLQEGVVPDWGYGSVAGVSLVGTALTHKLATDLVAARADFREVAIDLKDSRPPSKKELDQARRCIRRVMDAHFNLLEQMRYELGTVTSTPKARLKKVLSR